VNPAALPIIKYTLSIIDRFFKETKGRRTRRAIYGAERALRRAIKLYPELGTDKTFKRHYGRFNKNKIRK